jgi:hypothetical protein
VWNGAIPKYNELMDIRYRNYTYPPPPDRVLDVELQRAAEVADEFISGIAVGGLHPCTD